MRVLLVEDEPKLGLAIKKGLQQESYAVDLLTTAEDGLAYAETENYDVMIFDRMLPGGRDGLEICHELRTAGNKTPILLLTALGEVTDRVAGLDNGADDYLVKPFNFDELLARLRALIRRPPATVTSEITVADMTINMTNKTVHRNKSEIKLSRTEYGILQYLAIHAGQIISKEQLIQHVWDFDATVLPNTVEVFMRGLRKKLDKPKQESYIETVRGFGYRIAGTD